MIVPLTPSRRWQALLRDSVRRLRPSLNILALLILFPALAMAQGSPFDNGFTALQTLFTGTVGEGGQPDCHRGWRIPVRARRTRR